MNTATVLNQLLAAQGRTVRPGQAAAADFIDNGGQHVAAMCPTGVGKSALAVAVSVARKGGVIAVNSNGLVAQYVAEIPEWNKALGVTVAALVGRAHYWCPKASPSLLGFSDAAKAHVEATGSFIGSGVEKAVYTSHSVVALSPIADADEPDMRVSPCSKCSFKNAGCPLWEAREAAGKADVIITNATMLGFSITGATDWAKNIRRPVIVLDEADSCREPIAKVLGAQITVRGARDRKSALLKVVEWANDNESEGMLPVKARKFLAAKKVAEAEGREIVVGREDNKIVLSIPADLSKVFAPLNVVAMSATLSQRNADDLGLNTTVVNFQGLDVSASTVTLLNDAPGWMWGKDGPPAAWSEFVANEITVAFRDGGRTLGLFQSNADMNAVIGKLPADVRSAVQVYSSKTDRTAVVASYTANPDKVLLLGLVQGAGRGLNLPGELLRKVIVSRVPQNAPKDADKAVWLEDSRASVTQSVGRAHRHDGDYGNVRIVNGFGSRQDVADALVELGWKVV